MSEAMQVNSSETQSFQAEEDIDVGRLVHENQLFKKMHKELTTQVQCIESKMNTIKTEVTRLYTEQHQTKTNENFLKNVLKSITKVYGFDNIAKIIENDSNTNSPLQKQFNFQADSFEMCSNNAVLSRSNSNRVCESFVDKYEVHPEYQDSEHFSTNSYTPFTSENNLHSGEQADALDNHGLFSLNIGHDSNFNDADIGNLLDVSPKLSQKNSYVIWVDELKNKESNLEMMFCHSNHHLNGGLSIENF